eukprot:g19906.t3
MARSRRPPEIVGVLFGLWVFQFISARTFISPRLQPAGPTEREARATPSWGPYSAQIRLKKWLSLAREIPSWAPSQNPLVDWWDSHRAGLLATKSPNYFEVYHRHLQHFRRRRPHLLEIGLGSGGALEMWKDYFGSTAPPSRGGVPRDGTRRDGARAICICGGDSHLGFDPGLGSFGKASTQAHRTKPLQMQRAAVHEVRRAETTGSPAAAPLRRPPLGTCPECDTPSARQHNSCFGYEQSKNQDSAGNPLLQHAPTVQGSRDEDQPGMFLFSWKLRRP